MKCSLSHEPSAFPGNIFSTQTSPLHASLQMCHTPTAWLLVLPSIAKSSFQPLPNRTHLVFQISQRNIVNIQKQPDERMKECSFTGWQTTSRKRGILLMQLKQLTQTSGHGEMLRPFLELIKCFNSQESPRDGEAVFAQQSNFLQKTKSSWENAERPAWKINATEMSLPGGGWRASAAGTRLSYLWDKAALWCSVTLRCSWRHSSGEPGRHLEGPQTIIGEDVTDTRSKTGAKERDFCTAHINIPPPTLGNLKYYPWITRCSHAGMTFSLDSQKSLGI